MPAFGSDMEAPHEAAADRLQLVVPQEIRAYKQWLVWRYEPGPDKPRKVPYYVNGTRRSGVQGSAADLAGLETFESAVRCLRSGAFDGVGLAVLENSPIKAIDLDNCVTDGRLSAEAEAIVTEADSYSELSPSGSGVRILVFGVLPSKKAMNHYGPGRHVELFGTTGFVTITGNVLGDSGIRPMSHAFQAWITSKVGAESKTAAPAPQLTLVIDEQQRVELRSALNYLDADDYESWIDVGMALKSLGDVGRGLWMEWSQQSPRFDAQQAVEKWLSFDPSGKIGYRSVFYRASARGWVNPASARGKLPGGDPGPAEAGASYVAVRFDDLDDVEPAAPTYCWDGLIPVGAVTLLGAHGGTGKSTIALMLSVCTALGLPLFGVATRPCNVVFFSGEDPAETVRYRLRKVCKTLGVSAASLVGRLHILDATDGNPVLYREDGSGRRGAGVLTQTYLALSEYTATHDVGLLVVDNASDAYDASEIDRAKVRSFMRSLVRLAQATAAGVLLLAHVDKVTARGLSSGSDSYSGSTAWHNSARSRLFLSRDKDGTLLLEHQKHNLGKLAEPIRLVWPEGGMPQVDVPVNGFVQAIAERSDMRSLLRLIAEFTERGEFVTTAVSGRVTAATMFRREPSFARVEADEVLALLRRAERAGQIERVAYRNAERKHKERWQVTAVGREAAGLAPNAPNAPNADIGAISAFSANGAEALAPNAPNAALGGVGDLAHAIRRTHSAHPPTAGGDK